MMLDEIEFLAHPKKLEVRLCRRCLEDFRVFHFELLFDQVKCEHCGCQQVAITRRISEDIRVSH